MFDTMTGVKLVGGFCGALLLFLLGGWAAEVIYHVGGGGHGEAEQAYSVPVEEAEGGGEEAGGEAVPFADVFAAADPGAGERLFRQCGTCHKLDGSNATGPHLDGVVGRAVGSVADFAYSDAMASHGGEWTPEELSHFLEDPAGLVPGTKMTYRGMDDVEDRANLIAYLQTVGG